MIRCSTNHCLIKMYALGLYKDRKTILRIWLKKSLSSTLIWFKHFRTLTCLCFSVPLRGCSGFRWLETFLLTALFVWIRCSVWQMRVVRCVIFKETSFFYGQVYVWHHCKLNAMLKYSTNKVRASSSWVHIANESST